MKIKIGSIYKHRNSGVYKVIALARNSNDCTQHLVVYESVYDGEFPAGTVFVKPLNEFTKAGRFVKI